MMLVTCTCVPPSCSARLPQKFSAATTLITVELPRALVGEVEQPASASISRTAAPAARRVDDMARTLTKTGSVIKCTGRYTTRSAGAARIRCREAAYRFGAGTATQLLHAVAHVHLDRADAQEQLPPDLPAGQPVADQTQHLRLPCGQDSRGTRYRERGAEAFQIGCDAFDQ